MSGLFSINLIDETLFFSWKLKGWEAWATQHIEGRLRSGRVPCWLDEYAEFTVKNQKQSEGSDGEFTEAS
jgi:hypothetical protein